MTDLLLTQAQKDELKTRQVAFLQQRLLTAQAEAEWRANVRAVYDEWLATRLDALADEGALTHAIETALSDESVHRATRSVSRAVQLEVMKGLREDQSYLGDYVPSSARDKLAQVLERPNLIPESLLRKVIEQDVVEEVLRDVLYDALKEFNEKVNPFFADWGLPTLLKRFMPIGSGVVLKSLGSMRAEFDKRLEPEMRRFLQGFSRKALRTASDLAVAKSDSPKAVALRRNVAGFFYEEKLANFVKDIDDETASLLHEASFDVVAHVINLESVRQLRRETLHRFMAQHGTETVATLLAQHGVTHAPNLDALAAATWPALRATLENKAFRQWLTVVVGEFFDQLP